MFLYSSVVMEFELRNGYYNVSFSYHPLLVTCIKRIPSARFNGKSKSWFVSVDDVEYLKRMEAWAKSKGFCRAVRWVDNSIKGEDFTAEDLPCLRVNHNMLIEPYEYQRQGIAYALEKKRCIMGDEPGLGKTAQAIGTITASGAYPVLVICPSSLKVNWQREFLRFGGVKSVILSDDNKETWQEFWHLRSKVGEPLAKVFITNYESLKKFFVTEFKESSRLTIRSFKFDARKDLFKSVIVDESHKCKSSRTIQSKLVQCLAEGKEYVLCLTGTPVINSNVDLVQQLRVLDRLDDFGGYSRFMARYCEGKNLSSNSRELNYYLQKFCFFRRQKSDVLEWLPEKTRSYLVVDIENRSEYDAARKDIIGYLREYRSATSEDIMRAIRGAVMVKMGILKQISARGKLRAAYELIHNMVDGGHKLIVFCFLKEVVSSLKEEFPKAVTVTGDDNDKEKQRSVDAFQNDPDTRLIVLNYRSGGTGLTLTAASNVLFIEFPWTYADCIQAEDRAHRNGQRNAVTCTYLLGKDTIDEYMYKLIQSKKSVSDDVTGTRDNVQQILLNAAFDLFKDEI